MNKKVYRYLICALFCVVVMTACATQNYDDTDTRGRTKKTTQEHTHDYMKSVAIEATCERNGLAKYVCDCGDAYEEDISALGHEYERKVDNYYECQRCHQVISVDLGWDTIPTFLEKIKRNSPSLICNVWDVYGFFDNPVSSGKKEDGLNYTFYASGDVDFPSVWFCTDDNGYIKKIKVWQSCVLTDKNINFTHYGFSCFARYLNNIEGKSVSNMYNNETEIINALKRDFGELIKTGDDEGYSTFSRSIMGFDVDGEINILGKSGSSYICTIEFSITEKRTLDALLHQGKYVVVDPGNNSGIYNDTTETIGEDSGKNSTISDANETIGKYIPLFEIVRVVDGTDETPKAGVGSGLDRIMILLSEDPELILSEKYNNGDLVLTISENGVLKGDNNLITKLVNSFNGYDGYYFNRIGNRMVYKIDDWDYGEVSYYYKDKTNSTEEIQNTGDDNLETMGGKSEINEQGDNSMCHTHIWVTDKAVVATCKHDGITEGSHCSECGEVRVAQQVIPASHSPVADNGVAANCTKNGLTEGSHCSTCGQIIVAQQVIPAAHNPVIDKAIPATCTTDGLTEGSHCSVCGTILKKQDTIPAQGHDTVIDPAVNPTCTLSGETEGSHCAICGCVLKTQIDVPATGHKVVYVPQVEPTCTTPGHSDGSYCEVCGEEFYKQIVLPAYHIITTSRDFVFDDEGKFIGEMEKTWCYVCGEVFKTELLQ